MTQTIEKTRTLEECEANIERYLKSFWEMGEEYRYIRDNDLYKPEKGGSHTRWADYCKERWGFHVTTVDNVVKATEVRERLAASNDVPGRHQLPTNEKQTRPLAGIPREEHAEAWNEAVERAKDQGKPQPTHDDVKRVVDRRRRPTPAPEPTPADLAHDAAKWVRDSGESFDRAVEKLIPHLANLSEDEAQGCAYKIVETVHRVMALLEEVGGVPPSVARGVLGSEEPEDGRFEIAT